MSKKFEMKYLNKNGQYETLVPDGVIANDETKFLRKLKCHRDIMALM